MSQCPYTARLLEWLIPFAREVGSDRVRIRPEYIGLVRDGELRSLHGPSEIQGNIIELCVHEHASYERWLDFLECFHSDLENIPDGWESCAQRAEVDGEAVSACMSQSQGERLLVRSFDRTRADGVSSSPTMVVGDALVVGARDLNRLGGLFCSRMTEPLPAACDGVESLHYVPAIVLVDQRCTRAECDTEDVEADLRSLVWGAEINRLDYSDPQGRALFKTTGLRYLPALLVGEELADDPAARGLTQQLPMKGAYYVSHLGRFDPVEARWVARPEIGIKVLVDQRCQDRECDVASIVSNLEGNLRTAHIEQLDYSSAAGRQLFDGLVASRGAETGRSKLTLPLAVYEPNIVEEEDFFGVMGRYLDRVDDRYLMILGDWDPTLELCDNGEDDDGDRLIDCRDSDCSEQRLCRPEKARRLDLFVMSQCPWGANVVKAMPAVLDHFGRSRSKIDLRVQFIGEITDEGELDSLHGSSEVMEDIRQLCVQHHYRRGYAFIDYLDCRARDYSSDDWERCVQPPLNAAVIRRCAEGPLGERLLRESFELADQLEIRGSPSWLLNNRLEMRGRDPQSIVDAFCEHNELPECSQEVEVPEDLDTQGDAEGGCG